MSAAAGTIFREEVRREDAAAVRRIVASSGFFSPEEIAIAVELVTERLDRGPASGYHFIFAEDEGGVIGYTCFGPIPATRFSYDLYWIAVHARRRGGGIGRRLIELTEQGILCRGGRRVYAETSGRALYAVTRAFYAACGYVEEAVLKDFYAPGDAKHFFVKVL